VAEPIKQPTEDSTEDLTRTVTLETYVDDTSSGSEDESTLERARVHPMLRPEEKEEESVIFYSPAAEALRLKRLAMAAKSIRPELGDEARVISIFGMGGYYDGWSIIGVDCTMECSSSSEPCCIMLHGLYYLQWC